MKKRKLRQLPKAVGTLPEGMITLDAVAAINPPGDIPCHMRRLYQHSCALSKIFGCEEEDYKFIHEEPDFPDRSPLSGECFLLFGAQGNVIHTYHELNGNGNGKVRKQSIQEKVHLTDSVVFGVLVLANERNGGETVPTSMLYLDHIGRPLKAVMKSPFIHRSARKG